MTRKTKYDYYDDAFKATAVELGALKGIQAQDVAKILDIHPVMLYRWKKEYREGIIMKKQTKPELDTQTSNELKRLRKMAKSFERLQMKHDLLKKSIQFCSEQKKKSSLS